MEDLVVTEVGTTPGTRTTPTTDSRDLNNVGAGELEGTPEPDTNGGVRQSTRRRRSPKSEDTFSVATDSTNTGEHEASTRKSRRNSSGSEKRSVPEETENEVSSSTKAGISKRQSTRTRTPRQSYQEQFFNQGSEKVSLHYLWHWCCALQSTGLCLTHNLLLAREKVGK
jgi:hypothetical protein